MSTHISGFRVSRSSPSVPCSSTMFIFPFNQSFREKSVSRADRGRSVARIRDSCTKSRTKRGHTRITFPYHARYICFSSNIYIYFCFLFVFSATVFQVTKYINVPSSLHPRKHHTEPSVTSTQETHESFSKSQQ